MKVLLLIRRTRIVEHHDPHRMAVPPEVLVVLFDGRAHVQQAVRWNHEGQLVLFHNCSLARSQRAANVRRIVVPWPIAAMLLWTSTHPPCAAMMSRMKSSARPAPRTFRPSRLNNRETVSGGIPGPSSCTSIVTSAVG